MLRSFPLIPGAVPNLTVMMLGERVADWLSATDPCSLAAIAGSVFLLACPE
jgi:choline dehydrogenase-like flavoprotein